MFSSKKIQPKYSLITYKDSWFFCFSPVDNVTRHYLQG